MSNKKCSRIRIKRCARLLIMSTIALLALAVAKVYFTDVIGKSETLQVIIDSLLAKEQKGQIKELGYNIF